MTANVARPPLRSGARSGVLAVLDQAVVSGTNFCATILVGRATTKSELGAYALGFTVLVLGIAVQQALVCLPFTVFGPRVKGGRQRRLFGSALALGGALAAICSLGLAVVAAVTWYVTPAGGLATLWLTLAMSVPFVLLREFARRIEFARLRVARALILDSLLAALQIGGLSLLYVTGNLSAVTAYLCLGATCGAAGVAWVVVSRDEFSIRPQLLWRELSRNWSFGRWVLAGNLVSFGNAYLLHWILAFRLGVDATGALAVCWTLIDLSNPFVLGLGNWLGPRGSHALHTEGVRGLRRVAAFGTALITGTMTIYAALLCFFGSAFIERLFKPEYAPPAAVVAILALAALATSAGVTVADGLTTMERPRINLYAGLLALTVAALGALLLTERYQLAGGAAAVLIGNLLNTAVRTSMFCVLTRPEEKSA